MAGTCFDRAVFFLSLFILIQCLHTHDNITGTALVSVFTLDPDVAKQSRVKSLKIGNQLNSDIHLQTVEIQMK